MKLVNVFLGAPEGLGAERRAFHEAIADVNEAEGAERGTLFVPLFVSRKVHEQDVIDANIRSCTYYLLALDNHWGPPGRGFEHDLQVALAGCHDPGLPMREVVVLLKKPAADRPMEPAVAAFRDRTPVEGDPRRLEFDGPPQFKAIVRDLLSGWLMRCQAT
jgi:hypothetical protein